MGSNRICTAGPREAIQVVNVSTLNVVEVGNVHRKTVRHDGYTGVWVCVETALLFPRFRQTVARPGSQKWYATSFDYLVCRNKANICL